MNEEMKILAELGISLTTLAVKGTVSSINTKIKALKNEKNLDNLKNNYDEIVNELISEREEAIRLALAYKAEVDKIEISEKDIVHLHNTISKGLDLLNNFNSPDKKIDENLLLSIKALISVDTLKAMQLLGFNYKQAIGEPLTNLCSNFIESKLTIRNNKGGENK